MVTLVVLSNQRVESLLKFVDVDGLDERRASHYNGWCPADARRDTLSKLRVDCAVVGIIH